MSFLIFVLIVGLALFVRLRHQDWRTWVLWIGGAILGFTARLVANESPQQAEGLVLTASAVGLLGPEIWKSTRGWVGNPKNFHYVALGAVGLLGLFYPPLLGALMSLGIMWIGLRIILGMVGGKKKV